MRATCLQRAAQRCAGTQQMGLAHVFIEGLGSQSISQRAIGTVAARHWPPRPMTSTPGGGTNENRSGAIGGLRLELEKVS